MAVARTVDVPPDSQVVIVDAEQLVEVAAAVSLVGVADVGAVAVGEAVVVAGLVDPESGGRARVVDGGNLGL